MSASLKSAFSIADAAPFRGLMPFVPGGHPARAMLSPSFFMPSWGSTPCALIFQRHIPMHPCEKKLRFMSPRAYQGYRGSVRMENFVSHVSTIRSLVLRKVVPLGPNCWTRNCGPSVGFGLYRQTQRRCLVLQFRVSQFIHAKAILMCTVTIVGVKYALFVHIVMTVCFSAAAPN